MSQPTARDIPKIVEWIRTAASWLEQQGEEALDARPSELTALTADRAEDAGPVSGGGMSDPTSSAATSDVDHEAELTHQLHTRQDQVRFLMGTMWSNGTDLVENIDAIMKSVAPAKRIEKASPALCCERFCEDEASPKCAGRCEACYRWKKRYEQARGEIAPNVPQSVIEQRLKVRNNEKVYINGPQAGSVAS